MRYRTDLNFYYSVNFLRTKKNTHNCLEILNVIFKVWKINTNNRTARDVNNSGRL